MDGKGRAAEADGETENHGFVGFFIYSLIKEFRIMIKKGKFGLYPLFSIQWGLCIHI